MDENNPIDLIHIEFEDFFLSERELVERLAISKSDNKIDFNLFANLIHQPIGYEEFSKYKGFLLKFETLRQDLGFSKGEKPGDIDILLIPYSESEIYFSRTCAIEVKVVRPRRNNPKKAPNSYGIKQIEGLIKDGFPLVGLIHICMTEPLRENEKSTTKYDLTPFDMDDPYNNKDFSVNTVEIKYDHFSEYSAIIQMKKLLSKEIPKYVGLNTIGVNIEKDGSLITSFNQDFNNGYCSGYFNPHKKKETVEKIRHFYEKNKSKFKNAVK